MRRQIPWLANVKLMGWLPALGSAVAILLGTIIVLTDTEISPNSWPPARIVAAVIPLMFSLQVAFLFAIDQEPALELLASYPHTLPRLLLERLLVLLILYSTIALAGNLIGLTLPGAMGLATAVLRWLPPTLFLGGAVLFVVQMTRQGSFGALITILLWVGMFFGGNAVVLRWPSLQPIHAFLQPAQATTAAYTTNRITLLILGLAFVFISLHLLTDEERVLGLRQRPNRREQIRRLPLITIAVLILWYSVALLVRIDTLARPTHSPVCCLTPADFGFDYEEVSFRNEEQLRLSGWYIPSQNEAAVILLHGNNGHRAMMLPQAGMLAQHGYGVLMYDLRGHGQSGGNGRALGWPDVTDTAAAIQFLQNREDVNAARIGILGFSIGGQIALRTAAQTEAIKAVVADGPGFANIQDLPPAVSLSEQIFSLNDRLFFRGLAWRTGESAPPAIINSIAAIAPRPILLIATGPEQGGERRIAQHLYNHAHEPKNLWVIPETSHGRGPTAQAALYESKIMTLFDESLRGDAR